MKRFMLMMVLLLGGSLVGCSNETIELERMMTNEQWIEDIDYMVSAVTRMHPNPFLKCDETAWMESVNQLKADVETLSELHIKFNMQKLMAKLQDAHTGVYFEEEDVFPLSLRYYEDQLRVVGAQVENQDILGATLVQINDTALSNLERLVDSIIPHESQNWAKVNRPNQLVREDVLTFFEVIDEEPVVFTFDLDGELITKTLATINWQEYDETLTYFNRTQLPLRSQRPNDQVDPYFWYTYLESEQALYFQYNVCVASDYAPFSSLINELKTLITNQNGQMKKMVIDLRMNTGGNSAPFTSLASHLKMIQNEFPFEAYVLIGNQTFSSATIATLDAKQYLKATLIGEETGGQLKSFGNGPYQTLPNSNALFVVSTDFYPLGSTDTGVLPDIEVIETFEDYRQGIDKALEMALH